jgi:hypothetical protein
MARRCHTGGTTGTRTSAAGRRIRRHPGSELPEFSRIRCIRRFSRGAHGVSDGRLNRPRDAAESIHSDVTCAAFSWPAGPGRQIRRTFSGICDESFHSVRNTGIAVKAPRRRRDWRRLCDDQAALCGADRPARKRAESGGGSRQADVAAPGTAARPGPVWSEPTAGAALARWPPPGATCSTVGPSPEAGGLPGPSPTRFATGLPARRKCPHGRCARSWRRPSRRHPVPG